MGPYFSNAQTLVLAGNEIFVEAEAANGTEGVWAVSGGTATQISPATTFNVDGLVAAGNQAYFSAFDANLGKYTLWVTNGSQPATEVDPSAITDPQGLVASGATLYFSAYDPATGFQLWSTAGTAASTTEITDTNTGGGYGQVPENLSVVGSLAYFTQFDTSNLSTSLYTSTAPPPAPNRY